jgi:hypothetical protein
MEINALFDLWDKFANRMDHFGDTLTEHFYDFPVGTPCVEVIAWFANQNPYFEVIDRRDRQKPRFIAVCVPAKQDDDKPKEIDQIDPEPPRYA